MEILDAKLKQEEADYTEKLSSEDVPAENGNANRLIRIIERRPDPKSGLFCCRPAPAAGSSRCLPGIGVPP